MAFRVVLVAAHCGAPRDHQSSLAAFELGLRAAVLGQLGSRIRHHERLHIGEIGIVHAVALALIYVGE